MTNPIGNKRGLKKGLMIGLPILATVLVVGLAFQLNGTDNTLALNNTTCMSLEQFANIAKFPIKYPTELPSGYSLQCSKAEVFQAFLIYAPNPLSKSDKTEQIMQDRAIIIIATDATIQGTVQPKTPEERIQQTTHTISPERMQEMNAKFININGHPAWGREAGNYGIEQVQFADGTVISTKTTYEVARLEIAIGNIDYVIEADRPLDELIQIAKSMQ